MKRILLICLVFCLFVSVSESSQIHNFKGKSWLSGNMGYAFGMGDAFTSFTEPLTNTEFSSDAGIGFGGQYYYGVKENLLIGGELMFHSACFRQLLPPGRWEGGAEMPMPVAGLPQRDVSLDCSCGSEELRGWRFRKAGSSLQALARRQWHDFDASLGDVFVGCQRLAVSPVATSTR